MQNELTFEQVNEQVTKADLSAFRAGGAKNFSGADVKAIPGDVLQKICSIYQVLKPILKWVLVIPLPAAWKEVIKTFMELMDKLCPE